MKKGKVTLRNLIIMCVFTLVMGVMLIPQTANAAEDQTIYWKYSSNTLTLSDQPIDGSSGSFSASTRFTVGYYEPRDNNPRPWDSYYYSIRNVVIQGNLQPIYTDYWFADFENLSYVDVSNIDFSNCVSMKGMFASCGKSASTFCVKFGADLDTSQCKNMDYLFADCDRFHPEMAQTENFDKLNTSSCTTMKAMFRWCQNIPSIDLSNFDLSNCTNTSEMFSYCYSLTDVDMTNVDLSKCTDMSNMFAHCTDLSELDLSTADISKCTNFSNMLNDCRALTKIVVGDSYVTEGIQFPTKTGYFWVNEETEALYPGGATIPAGSGTYVLTDVAPAKYNAYWALTANEQNYDLIISPEPVTGDYSGAFSTLTDPKPWESAVAKSKILSVTFQKGANGSKVNYNSIAGLFQSYSSMKTIDLAGLDISECRSADNLFSSCSKLEAVSLKDLDWSQVTSMKSMFSSCSSLKVMDLTFINTDYVTNMTGMLTGCSPDFLIIGPSWQRNVLSDSVLPNYPCDLRLYNEANGVYYSRNVIKGYFDVKADLNKLPVGLDIYYRNSADREDVRSLQNALSQINALTSESSPEAAEAAQSVYNRMPEKMRSLVPAEYLAALRNAVAAHPDAVNGKLPQQIKVRWSSLDGENLKDPITFEVSPDENTVGDFIEAHYDTLCEHFAKEGYSFDMERALGYAPMTTYVDRQWSFFTRGLPYNMPDTDQPLSEFTLFYFYGYKILGEIELSVDPPVCGWPVSQYSSVPIIKGTGEGMDNLIYSYNRPFTTTYWKDAPDASSAFQGTIKGGDTYYASSTFTAKLGYTPEGMDLKAAGDCELAQSGLIENDQASFAMGFTLKATAVHDLDSNGICKQCGEEALEPGIDGTMVGPGAGAATAEKAITSMTSDTDPAGSVFSRLAFKSKKQSKSSIKLNWNKIGNAQTYVLYGNKCGKGIKPVKIATSKSNVLTVKTIGGKKLAKGTYYKFIIVALDKNNKVVSTSKLIHVATSGGKVGNHKKVTVKKSVTKKAKKLKKGKSLKLKAKAVKKSKKVKKHVGVRYESTNSRIAAVSAKGVVKANSKGTCYVYAYAQNGVFKKIKVTVK